MLQAGEVYTAKRCVWLRKEELLWKKLIVFRHSRLRPLKLFVRSKSVLLVDEQRQVHCDLESSAIDERERQLQGLQKSLVAVLGGCGRALSESKGDQSSSPPAQVTSALSKLQTRNLEVIVDSRWLPVYFVPLSQTAVSATAVQQLVAMRHHRLYGYRTEVSTASKCKVSFVPGQSFALGYVLPVDLEAAIAAAAASEKGSVFVTSFKPSFAWALELLHAELKSRRADHFVWLEEDRSMVATLGPGGVTGLESAAPRVNSARDLTEVFVRRTWRVAGPRAAQLGAVARVARQHKHASTGSERDNLRLFWQQVAGADPTRLPQQRGGQ